MNTPIEEFHDGDNEYDEERQPTAEPDGMKQNKPHIFVPRCSVAERKNNDQRNGRKNHGNH